MIITLLIWFCLSLLVIGYCFYKVCSREIDIDTDAVLILCIVILSLLIIHLGVYYIFYYEPIITTEIRELIALKVSNNTEGQFFLGCGSFQDTICYYFYYKDVDGAIVFKKVPIEICRVYEISKIAIPKVIVIHSINDSVIFGIPKDSIYREINIKLP